MHPTTILTKRNALNATNNPTCRNIHQLFSCDPSAKPMALLELVLVQMYRMNSTC